MDDVVGRRVFRAALLVAIEETHEAVAQLDTEDAEGWSTNLRKVFIVADRVASLVLNAMNSEAIRKNRERAAGKKAR